jgi:hypothetical protein
MKILSATALKVLVPLAYVAMIAVNYLANALPIGGVTTGQASDSYPNLFTPTGPTFSIWGLIYLLLGGFVIYFLLHAGQKSKQDKTQLLEKTGLLFILNALANISWIFAWHYGQIALSVAIMLILLVTLIRLTDLLKQRKLNPTEKIWLRLPFSIYFGWITIATIANITVLLVSLNWDGFGIPPEIWTIVILLTGAAIGIARGLKDQNIPYLLVLIWAYLGIMFKHISASGFNAQYPDVIATLVICLILFSFFTGKINGSNSKKN